MTSGDDELQTAAAFFDRHPAHEGAEAEHGPGGVGGLHAFA